VWPNFCYVQIVRKVHRSGNFVDEKFLGVPSVLKVCQSGISVYEHLDDHLNESQHCQF
jgi:hypothetical protein